MTLGFDGLIFRYIFKERKQAANQSGASGPARTSTQVQLQQLQVQHRRNQHYSPIHVQAQHGQFETQQQNVFPQQQNVNMYSRYQQPQSASQYGPSTEVYHQHIPQVKYFNLEITSAFYSRTIFFDIESN